MAVEMMEPVEVPASADQRVTLHEVSWSHFELLLSIRGDAPLPRLTYLEGELELTSRSQEHERIKSLLGRLLEAYADIVGVDLNAYGSWTVRSAARARGIEPDECYVLGERDQGSPVSAPDLAIEVIWTSGGIDKLEVFRGLGIGEVWFWRGGAIEVYLLAEDAYQRVSASRIFPALDLDLVARLLANPNQSEAVRQLRAAVSEES